MLFRSLPVLALWPLVRGGRRRLSSTWSSSAGFVCGVLLVLAPVAVRNGLVGGVWALTTSGAGTNVYGGNNADNPLGVATEFDWVRGIPEYEAGDWRREAERRTGRELDPGEVSSYWLGQVVESVRSDPGLHAGILWSKWRLAWGAYEVPDNHHLGWDARFVPLVRGLLVAGEGSGFALLGGLGLLRPTTEVMGEVDAVLPEVDCHGNRFTLTVSSRRAHRDLGRFHFAGQLFLERLRIFLESRLQLDQGEIITPNYKVPREIIGAVVHSPQECRNDFAWRAYDVFRVSVHRPCVCLET